MTSLQGWTFSMLTVVLQSSSSETKRGLQQTGGDLHPTAQPERLFVFNLPPLKCSCTQFMPELFGLKLI